MNLQFILKYALASPYYKELNKSKFELILGEIDANELLFVSERVHLTSILHKIIQQNNPNHKFIQLARPILYYQKILNTCVIEELEKLSKYDITRKIKPVLLKGVAFWSNLYKDNIERRINDIDLLIENRQNIIEFCNLLKKNGYRCEEQNYEQDIFTNKHYELPAFFKEIPITVNNEELLLQAKNISFSDLKINNKKGIYYLQLEIELHKAIFSYKNTAIYPVLKQSYFKSFSPNNTYRVLKNEITLPYLAIKIFSDYQHLISENELIKLKALKLVKDFILIMQVIDQKELEKAIIVAEIWDSLNVFRSMISFTKDFLPEINFDTLHLSQENNLVDLIIKNAIKQIINNEKNNL